MYADIIVDISADDLDRPYQYLIPDKLAGQAQPGTRVLIPFGRGNRIIKGYIIGLSDRTDYDPERIKSILSVDSGENGIEARLIGLAWWMKEHFGSTMNEALKAVLPVRNKVREQTVRTIAPKTDTDGLRQLCAESERRKYVAKARFYRELLQNGSLDYDLAVKKLNISPALIKKAEADGIISISSAVSYRNPFKDADRSDYHPPLLNPEQKAIADSIKADLDAGIRADYLIHGITGSGKTEIYMDVIEKVVASGRQVIMLIPEISLTYQTVKRFYMRFGDRISVMNSRLSGGEKYDQYMRARSGDTDIVIGPRSALFMPFERLGLIIMDEEHEPSYRSESSPCYNAREVALKRAEMEGASVILGSATPSLEAYGLALAGRLRLFTLDKRAGNALMPGVSIVDMRDELKARNRSMFSRKLQEAMADRLDKGQQIMLFLNRRGYSGLVSCRNCGTVLKCPHCDISMTAHRDGTMMCHYCGYAEPIAKVCPKCGSPYIGSLGIGTQKVEEQIRMMFPAARVLRMDADSTRHKDSYDEILSAFANEEADILIGTQMIVKGHDFAKVTLVGILLADLSLYSADFRSGERTFDLLAQAAGRAGRGSLPGEVVIQTYNPEHYSIVTAAAGDYRAFYDEEMAFRRMMGYPPARVLFTILLMSADEAEADRAAAMVRKLIEGPVNAIGPAPAPLAKANDIYRRIIYVKSSDYAYLMQLKEKIASACRNGLPAGVSIQYKFN